MKEHMRSQQHGFTMVEMAIVIIVIGLLLGGILRTVSIQRQQVMRDETRQQLNVINDALLGFAMTTGRLPCPDTDNDGQENNSGAPLACDADGGFLPYVDLGIGERDSWGNNFRYRVTGSFADSATNPSFTLDPLELGDILIDNDVGTIAEDVPAVVISYGKNGASTINSIVCGAGTPSTNEDENCDNDTSFMANFYSEVAGSEFDDLVSWIPLARLKAKMVEAGQLP